MNIPIYYSAIQLGTFYFVFTFFLPKNLEKTYTFAITDDVSSDGVYLMVINN